jgi:hypothetical protein
VPNLEDQIDAFAAGADGGSLSTDPDAKRTFKSINVPFNEYEYSKLETIAKKAKRSKLYMVREAIIKLADEMENN